MDEYEFDDAVEWQDWAERLERKRPEEYKTGELDWAEPSIAEGMDLVAESTATTLAAIRAYVVGKVKLHEKRAVARANDLLRTIARDGALPLDWMDFANLPIVIEGTRHKIAACSASQFEQWELFERRRAATDFVARNDACDGARLVRDWLLSAGASTLRDLDQ